MKTLNINCPEGYTIDQDKSDLVKGIVHFKKCKKIETYEEVAKILLKHKYYYICNTGIINNISGNLLEYHHPNNSTTRGQLESILALNKLCNVAKYLNNGWLPSFDKVKYYIIANKDILMISPYNNIMGSHVYFKSEKLAQQAIDILGEDVIKQALILNH